MRLLRVELRRMWHRKMPWFLLLGASAVIVGSGVVTFITHDATIPIVGDISAEVEETVAICRASAVEEWNVWNRGEMQGVDPGYEEYLSSFGSADAMADDQCDPRFFEGVYVVDPRFCLISLYEPGVEYRDGCPDFEGASAHISQPGTITVDGEQYQALQARSSGLLLGVSVFLFVLAAVLGASFIGAEYKAGTIETTLLWEPRRIRVLSAKFGAAGITAFAIHASLLGFFTLAMLPSAVWRGSTAGVDSAFWIGLVGVILRGGVAAAVVAALALSVSVVTRNTVGGVAVMLGYSAVGPSLSFLLLRGMRPFELTENMAAFANDGEVGRFVGSGQDLVSVYSHGVTGAAIVVVAYLAIATVIALLVFRHRDID